MFKAIRTAFEKLFDFIGNLFQWMMDGIAAIIQPIIDVFVGIGYFIYKIGLLLVELLALLGGVGKLAFGLLQGMYKTLTGFSYSGTSANLPGSFGEAFSHLQPIFQALQFNKIGYVVMFSIWLFTALAATRIIQTFRGGNDS